MQVTVLGSGTAVPVADRFPAGYLVQSDQVTAMVDCGPGSLRRLAQAGADIANLDAVFLTHFHTDHCADLGPLLFALRNPAYAGRKPLHIFAASGLERHLTLLYTAWPWATAKDYELRTKELTPGDLTFGDLEIKVVPIRHTAQSLGYRFTDPAGYSVAFSGDADECEELIDLARDTDLFVCDAAFPDEGRVEGHLTPGLAGQYAQQANCRALLLTHFYPECLGVDVRAQAKRAFDGEIIAATDLWTRRS